MEEEGFKTQLNDSTFTIIGSQFDAKGRII